MIPELKRPERALSLPTALCLLTVALIGFVAMRPLLPVDETRYLDVAWEMWLSGDLFHLTRNGDLYAHKPPLLFWIINLVWLGTGVSEFAARLVGPAFGLGTAVATARLARQLWPEQRDIAARAVMILAGFTVFVIYASATMFDTMLSLAAVLGIGLLWRIGQGARGFGPWAAFGAVLGFGVYAKGPVILVHLVPALLTMPLWAPVPPTLREAGKGAGLAVLLALALVSVWLVPAVLMGTEAYRHELLWTQTAGRVAGGFAHDRPVWFLLALLPLLLFPWGWSPALWHKAAAGVRTDAASRLVAIWAGAAFVAFSLISGKQAHYLLPEYPAMALLFARASLREDTGGAVRFAPAMVVPLIAGFLALAAAFLPLPADLSALTPAMNVAAVGGYCLALAAVLWRWRSATAALTAGLGLAVAAHLLIAGTGLRQAYDQAPISAEIRAAARGGIAIYGMTYNAEFDFAARTEAPLATPADAAALEIWLAAHPDGVILAPEDHSPFSSTPAKRFVYNGTRFGLWRVQPGLIVRG